MPALTPIDPTTLGIKERGQRTFDSPAGSFELNNSTLERHYVVPWANRLSALKFFLGEVETYDDSGTTKLSRTLPHTADSNFSDVVAVKCSRLTGFRWTGTANSGTPLSPSDPYVWGSGYANVFDQAELTIQYEHVPYYRVTDADRTTELDRWVSVDEYRPSAEYLTIPGSTMQFYRDPGGASPTAAPNGRGVPYPIGRVMPQTSITLTWHNLPNNVWTPDSTLWKRVFGYESGGSYTPPYIGTANKTAFLGFPAGTLLFENIVPVRNRSPYGSGFWYNLSYQFLYKPYGHYKLFFSPVSASEVSYAGFYYVGAVGDSYRTPATVPDFKAQYNAREFADLFKVS
jgi:hypothetical protein